MPVDEMTVDEMACSFLVSRRGNILRQRW